MFTHTSSLFFSTQFVFVMCLPTRFSNMNCTLIDNFLYKISHRLLKTSAGIILSTISDHLPYFVSLDYVNMKSSSSFLSFHQESYVCQIVPSQCLAQPMAMPLAVARSWGEQAVSIMGQTSRCCMVCLMP